MANAVKWTAYTERTIIEDGSCNDNATVAGTLDNATNKDRWLDLQLQVELASAPTAGTVFHCYAIPRVIGQAANPTLATPIGQFVVGASANAQICNTIRGIPLSPVLHDIVLENKTGQNAEASSVQLMGRTYNEEVQ